MIKPQGTDKLINNTILKILHGGSRNNIEINTFSVDIKIMKEILINSELLIYDPFSIPRYSKKAIFVENPVKMWFRKQY